MSEETIDPQRLLVPRLAGFYQAGSTYTYSFIRFCTGTILVLHGIGKLMQLPPSQASIDSHGLPLPELLAWLAVLTESFGALFLALGLFTRLCAIAVAIEMAVIVFFFQWQFGYFWIGKGIEFPLLWMLICIAIFFRGGGRYSLDHYLRREL